MSDAEYYQAHKDDESLWGPPEREPRPRTFHCQHMSIGRVVSAQCRHGCQMRTRPVTTSSYSRRG